MPAQLKTPRVTQLMRCAEHAASSARAASIFLVRATIILLLLVLVVPLRWIYLGARRVLAPGRTARGLQSAGRGNSDDTDQDSIEDLGPR